VYRHRGKKEAKEKAREKFSALDPKKREEKIFAYAVKLLAAKPRSIEELRERLADRAGSDDPLVEAAITKLKDYGYLDDDRFAFSFASYRTRQKPLGRHRLKHELSMKRISKETADKALDELFSETSEEDLIERAIEKRIRLRGRPKSRVELKHLYDHLLRLGFSYELISKKVREFISGDLNSELE
jgi:regulatory protein